MPELRHAIISDLEAMTEAERRCLPDPWSFRLLSGSLSSSYDSVFVLVAEDALLSYVNVRVFGDKAKLMRIAVLPRAWGQHLGLFLLRADLREMYARDAETATLEVRTGSTAAIQLCRKHGFLLAGKRKNYYEKPVEDALIHWDRTLSVWKGEVADT